MAVKILGGTFRGRGIAVPRQGVRPSSGRLKEALFSILGEAVVDALFLDLFAGAGSVGLEALSRGAKQVIFVDRDLRVARKNASILGVDSDCTFWQMDVFAALKRLAREKTQVDILFADPPYAKEISLGQRLFDSLQEEAVLGKAGHCFIEESAKQQPPPSYKLRTRRYGSSCLWESIG